MKETIVSKQRKSSRLRSTLLVLSLVGCTAAAATELVYFPLNPSFGGNPLNGPVLLNSALATSRHKDPDIASDRFGIDKQSPLENFQEMMERAILSQVASAATTQLFDSQGNFKPGTLQTENFTISIVDLGGGRYSITTTDKVTGGTTTFEVSPPTFQGQP
jgi:curli production assembly/transport component CsgF